jgi:NAD(P)-dependent dehydrogenase (short-subunit alcohol dehydrogenase family)
MTGFLRSALWWRQGKREQRKDMADTAVIIGGTQGLGRELASMLAARGEQVFLSGRDRNRSERVAADIGQGTRGLAVDLTKPHDIGAGLRDVPMVKHVVIAAIERDSNTARDYNIDRAIKLATLKLVGYTEVVHALATRLAPDASIVLFGGLAKERPYPGSTTVTTVNGAIESMVRTLAVELAPVRVNAVHPGIIGDTPEWAGKQEALDRTLARTPLRRLATMRDVAGAVIFLLDNRAVNGVNLPVDGGWLLT